MKSRSGKQNQDNREYSGIPELLDHETSLVKYSTHVVDLINNSIGSNADTRILEFGAGTGFLLEIFADKFGRSPEACEIDLNLVKVIEKKGFKCFHDLSAINEKYQVIYTSNVLEHIEDDVSILKDLGTILLDDGKLVIYVPAVPLLFSGLDEAVGHYRRYRKSELIEKLESAGFRVEDVRYVDSLGVLAALITKILGYKNGIGIGSNLSMKVYDFLVFPFSRFFDSIGFRHLIGKNLFIVASKS